MAQNSTSSDAVHVSHDELYDEVSTQSRYYLRRILKTICEEDPRNYETLPKWLLMLMSEDKVAQPEIPPRPENAWPAMDDDSEHSSSVDGPSHDETSETDHDDQSPVEVPTRPSWKKMKISLEEDSEEKSSETDSDKQTPGDKKSILCRKRKLSPEGELEDHQETHGNPAGDNEVQATSSKRLRARY